MIPLQAYTTSQTSSESAADKALGELWSVLCEGSDWPPSVIIGSANHGSRIAHAYQWLKGLLITEGC